MNDAEYHQWELEQMRRLEEDPKFREAFEQVFGKMYPETKVKCLKAQVKLETNFKRYKERFK